MSVNPVNDNIKPWADNKKLTVINILGGPGVGKSTVAAELFANMKKKGMKVELIHEIAKDFVWERWDHIFREQDYIFAHQHRLQRRLVGHDIDYVVIDSSLILGLFYTPDDFPPSFKQFLIDVYHSYDNMNIFLQRSDQIPYVQSGRNQNEEQARDIDQQVFNFLMTNSPEDEILYVIGAGDSAPGEILASIEQDRPKKNR